MKKITLLFLLTIFMACNDEHVELVLFEYAQTGCADPWEGNANSSNQVIITSVKSYLKSHSIPVYQVKVRFDESAVEMCESCLCRTGKIIQVYTFPDAELKLAVLGFVKIGIQQ